MQNVIRTNLAGWLAVGSVVVGMIGCGAAATDKVRLNGRVHRAGEPLKVEGAEVGLGMVKVEFYAIDEDGRLSTDPHGAVVGLDGAFAIGEQGLSPGKYRVCIYQWDPYPQVDRLNGQFDRQNSRITVEIRDNTPVEIDVSRPDGGLPEPL